MAEDRPAREVSARSNVGFGGLVASTSLTSFNENLFKETAMLLAVGSGNAWMQGWATVLFASPYILFAAVAGWLADRFAKRSVIIGCKAIEAGAAILGSIGLMTDDWTIIFLTAVVMATVSALLGPPVNGSIPEIYPDRVVPRANAVAKPTSGGMIFVAVAGAGFGLSLPNGRAIIAVTISGAAVAGLLAIFLMRRRPAADPESPTPWHGPLQSIRNLREVAGDRLLAIVFCADAFIWFLGSLQILMINYIGMQELHLGPKATGMLVIAELLGFAMGGSIAALLMHQVRWRTLAQVGLLMAGVFLAPMPLVVLLPVAAAYESLAILLFVAGLGGGAVMIPSESFIQVRAGAREKGKVWGAKTFLVFSGILVSGPLGNLLYGSFSGTTGMAFIAGGCVLGWIVLRIALRGVDDGSVRSR